MLSVRNEKISASTISQNTERNRRFHHTLLNVQTLSDALPLPELPKTRSTTMSSTVKTVSRGTQPKGCKYLVPEMDFHTKIQILEELRFRPGWEPCHTRYRFLSDVNCNICRRPRNGPPLYKKYFFFTRQGQVFLTRSQVIKLQRIFSPIFLDRLDAHTCIRIHPTDVEPSPTPTLDRVYERERPPLNPTKTFSEKMQLLDQVGFQLEWMPCHFTKPDARDIQCEHCNLPLRMPPLFPKHNFTSKTFETVVTVTNFNKLLDAFPNSFFLFLREQQLRIKIIPETEFD